MEGKSVNFSNSNFAGTFLQGSVTGNVNTHIESVDFSQNIGQNIDEITKLIGSIREMAQKFPEAQREEAMLHLDDLQEDITTPEKQTSLRIKTRIIALLGIAASITTVVAGAADFSNNVLDLSEKLGVPIEFNQSQPMQQLPPIKPIQPSDSPKP
jgi:hypothetical protein